MHHTKACARSDGKVRETWRVELAHRTNLDRANIYSRFCIRGRERTAMGLHLGRRANRFKRGKRSYKDLL